MTRKLPIRQTAGQNRRALSVRYVKIVCLFATLTLLSLFMFGCSSNKTPGIGETGGFTIRYGYQPGHSQIVIARDKGFLDEEFGKDNIKFDFEKFQSGPPLITAITSNSLDFGQVGDLPAILATANNVDITAIGAILKTEEANGLIALKGSGITKLEDIKGKKIGVTIGSTGHHLLYEYLESVNLTAEDINQVNLQPGDIVSSLVSGNIDAAVTWEPYLTITTTKGITDLVADARGYKKEVDVVIATDSFLAEHPDIAVRLLKVLDKSAKWIAENKDEALDLVAADAGLDKAALAPIFYKINLDVILTDDDIEGIKATEKFLKQYGLITEDVDIDQLVDTSYLKEAGLQ